VYSFIFSASEYKGTPKNFSLASICCEISNLRPWCLSLIAFDAVRCTNLSSSFAFKALIYYSGYSV